MQQHVSEDPMLVQLAFRQAQGKVRRVNRNIDLLQNVRQRAEMIFVAMGEDDGGNVFPVLLEDFEIGNANVYAIDALFGESHARVEHQHLVATAQQGTVHPELADAAEGNDFEDVSHLRLLLDSPDGDAEVYHDVFWLRMILFTRHN